MQQRQQVAQLSKVPLFANCSKRELARLLSRVRSEMVEAGHTLFLEGAPSGNLYIILSGSAVVRKNGRRIARVGAPCVASSAMSVSEQKRGASMRAQTCRVVASTRTDHWQIWVTEFNPSTSTVAPSGARS